MKLSITEGGGSKDGRTGRSVGAYGILQGSDGRPQTTRENQEGAPGTHKDPRDRIKPWLFLTWLLAFSLSVGMVVPSTQQRAGGLSGTGNLKDTQAIIR